MLSDLWGCYGAGAWASGGWGLILCLSLLLMMLFYGWGDVYC